MKPCDEWTGARSSKGYGQRFKDGRVQYTHRLAWEEAHGPIPAGLYVLHHCDNPPCREIEHLFLGTAADNTADMMAKGRNVIGRRYRGEANSHAKLTWEQVSEIRRLYSTGNYSHRRLALMFGVSKYPISTIVRGMTWRLEDAT